MEATWDIVVLDFGVKKGKKYVLLSVFFILELLLAYM